MLKIRLRNVKTPFFDISLVYHTTTLLFLPYIKDEPTIDPVFFLCSERKNDNPSPPFPSYLL